MSGTLIVAEHLRGRLRDVTRELVTAAQDFPCPVRVAVIAADPGPLADEADLRGVDETVWAPAEPGGGAARSELSVEAKPSRARHLSFVEVPQTDVDITSADFLLSIGRGIGDKENIDRFVRLAAKMGATISVSRPIVDAGWMPSARQVGQSGKTVKPKVYLAFGISGAVQHLAGMKGSGTIIAINTDPEAAIFGVAHYGAVVDLFTVADELEK